MKGADRDHIVGELNELKNKLFDFSARNPFVNSKRSQLYFLEVASGQNLQSIYKSAQFLQKEYGLESTLKVHSFLRWKEPQRKEFFTSPLVITPCKIVKKRKIETEFKITIDEDVESIINPVLVHSLKRFFDLDLSAVFVQDLPVLLKNSLSTNTEELILSDAWNENQEWQVISCEAVGSFNYKKSLLGSDFDHILKTASNSVARLLVSHKQEVRAEDTLNTFNTIVPLDFSQKEALAFANKFDLSLQGPPGTGKSHTIIALIGHFLSQNKRILFVSQKKSALDVVFNRLEKMELGHLGAYLNTNKDEKKQFYEQLKLSWEVNHNREKLNTNVQDLATNSKVLKFYQTQFFRGHGDKEPSSFELIKNCIKSNFKKPDLTYNGSLPKLSEWIEAKEFIFEFERIVQKEFKVKFISECEFIGLNKAIFNEKDPLLVLEKRLNSSLVTLKKLSSILIDFKLNKTIEEFTKMALAASILKMVNKSQLSLLDINDKKYKSFSSTVKKHESLKAKLSRAEQANSKWQFKPSKSEITELSDLIKHRHASKGILGILKRKSDRLSKAFQGFSPELSDVAKLQLLEELRSEWNLKAELEQVEIKLKHDFYVLDPQNEIRHILYLRSQLNNLSHSVYHELLIHEESEKLLSELSEIHSDIQSFNHVNRFIFDERNELTLDQELNRIQTILLNLGDFKLVQSYLQKYFYLSSDIRKFISLNDDFVEKLDIICNYHNLLERHKADSSFKFLSGHEISAELAEITRAEALSEIQMIENIKVDFNTKFNSFENLLNTPASKLSEKQKLFKKQIRSSKRNLIHEISKKQQHVSIKSFTSDNWEYLSNLVPLWVMNPLAVSERLPCVQELFDVVIFDEASQIPLEDGIPAIYRAKKVIVVGDDKQMPPSSFFSSSETSETLLNRANFSYLKRMLKWHYRSQHPQLISFSNRYFYENELLTVPPVKLESPFELVQCKGTFENSVNLIEAKQIANYLAQLLPNSLKSLGIIAFSKEQEKEITKQLLIKRLPIDKILIRNLENVQGIEKDIIIISMAYAKNPEGNFIMNFGPINRESGINRLNVLFTRAKKKLVFFTSVHSSDFKISDNQGISCLKDYLIHLENGYYVPSKNAAETLFKLRLTQLNLTHYNATNNSAINAYVQHSSGRILIIDPCALIAESKDLKTIYSVIKSRFSSVKIILSIDWWNNPEEIEAEIIRFFN
jgi:superfamily I DNA and/or RNA helicase